MGFYSFLKADTRKLICEELMNTIHGYLPFLYKGADIKIFFFLHIFVPKINKLYFLILNNRFLNNPNIFEWHNLIIIINKYIFFLI